MASSRPDSPEPFRAVVDPNVLVSAWVSPHGFPRRVLEAAEDGRFEMVVSRRMLDELTDVLSRERLRRYGRLELAIEHVWRVQRVGVHVEVEGEPERLVADDPKDDYLVALADACRASYIVSGDPHLRHLSQRRTPREFVGLLESERRDP